jgi:predicted MPP superfamily phosphohydrolase
MAQIALRRRPQPFLVIVTAFLTVSYAYVAARLASHPAQHLALAIPFILIWVVPAVYWRGRRHAESLADKVVLQASFVSMGWVTFLVLFSLARDAILIATLWPPELAAIHAFFRESGAALVMAASLLALGIGSAYAWRGPRVRVIDLPFPDLHEDLEGFRIAQVTDLHVGRSIGVRYVENVVALAGSLSPDVVVLTGDMVDGSVERLQAHVAPLRELAQRGRGYFVLGNHDCYSGPQPWVAHFRKLGFHVLLNEYAVVAHGRARIVIGGVLDPALPPGPRPDLAAAHAPPADFRLLLAHRPNAAPAAAPLGFDLQLSGHTHGGQFFPWTLVVRRVHAPHSHGLSREGRMWVYVSPGTGTWGPLVRLGTRPEVTLIRLVRKR